MSKLMRLWRLLLVGQLLLAFGLFSTSCGDDNYVVNTSTVCRCDASIEGPCFIASERWKHAVNYLLEVSAIDFRKGHFVGAQCQAEVGTAWEPWPFNFNAWRPFDGFKRNMSGQLRVFNRASDEDWNLHVRPNPAFTYLLDEVEALHEDSVDDHKRYCDPPCIETEISPDKLLWNNPWFYLPDVHPQDADGNGFSWLEGREMGFYGLWVMDANHDFRSEIHPVDMMWFKDHFAGGAGSSRPFDIFWLFFLQDNTGRFDDRDNFDCDGSAPGGWEPWAESPRAGQFNVAFEVDPASEVVNFYIQEIFKRFVVTSQDANASRDADNGKSHALEFDGKVVVRVEEEQPNDDDLGVTFTDICLGPDGKLRGFVSIRSKIGGNDDRDEEGFHVLYVARSKSASRPDAQAPEVGDLPTLLITAEEVGDSLSHNGNDFTGNLQLTLHVNERATEQDYTISKIEFAARDSRQEVRFEQDKRKKEVLVRDVPLVADGRIIVSSTSGLTLTLRTPALKLFPVIEETVTRSVIDRDAWKFLPASVGGVPGASSPHDRKLAALQELQLKLHPRYAASEGDEVVTDRASPFASELNKAIIKNERKVVETLFKSPQPFTLAWTFEATNLSTGQPVPVYTSNAPVSEGVQVEVQSGSVGNDSLKVKFVSPAPTGIVELRAKASVTDANGKTTVVERRLWSHGLQFERGEIDELASLLQALTGLKDRRALVAPRPKERFELPPDAKTRRAFMVDAYLRDTLRDKRITIEELRKVIRALKKFRADGGAS